MVVLAKKLPELPGVFNTPGHTDRSVAAEHDERGESVLMRTFGVREAVIERMLRREERHDVVPRDILAQVQHQMAKIVLFLGAHGAVGEEHIRSLFRQSPHGVVRVDPRIHSVLRRELRTRRAKFRREHRRTGMQRSNKVHGGSYYNPRS